MAFKARWRTDTITGVNDPPVVGTTAGLHLRADSYTAVQGIKLVVALPGVLGNDASGASSEPRRSWQCSLRVLRRMAYSRWLRTARSPTLPIRESDGIDTFTYQANNGTSPIRTPACPHSPDDDAVK